MRGAAPLLWTLALVACERPRSAASPAPPPPPPLVEDANARVDQWSSLVVENAGERSVLTLDGSWMLTEPVAAPADARAVTSLLRALGAPLVLRAAAPTPDQLRGWGLTPPRFRVEAASAGGPALAVRGGGEDAFDGSVAIQREGEAAVYALPGGAAQALALTSYALRDKAVLPWRAEDVARIEVTLPRGRFVVVRAGARDWKLDAKAAADRATIHRALSADRALRFLRFAPPGAAAPSKATAQVAWVSQQDERIELTLGATEGTDVYASRTEKNLTVRGYLPAAALELWRSGPAGLRGEAETAP